MNGNTLIARLKKHRFFSGLLDERTFGQFKRYVATGLLSFTIEYLLFFVLLTQLGLWYMLANTMVYVVVFWFNFFMNRLWSFKSKANLPKQIGLYGGLFVFNLAAINLLMYLFCDIAGIAPLISKVMVMGAVVSWNFILYKKVIYK